MMRNFSMVVLALSGAIFGLSVAFAEQPAPPPAKPDFTWPTTMKNRQVVPEGFGGDRLRRLMISYSKDLGVRCSFCHVGEEGKPLSTFDFPSDANPNKNIARGMLRLVHKLNTQEFDAIGLTDARVDCFTCHRGQRKPVIDRPPDPAAAAPAPAATPKTERG